MAFNFSKYKKHKTALIAFLALITIILVSAFLINRYWEPILSKKVKNMVLTSTDSLYNINFSSAELHVLEGRIILYNIDFKPDTAVYNRRKTQHLAPNNLVELHVKRLILANVHPFKLYFKHILDIGRITLTTPEIHLSYQMNQVKDTLVKDNRTPWQKISKSLKYIHVGDIFLNDVHFKYSDYTGNKLLVSELKEMNLQANDLLIDSATQTDRSRMLYCKDIVADLNNYKGKTPDGLYTYTINKLKLSTRTSRLNVQGLDLKPAPAFFNKSKKNRYTLHLDSIQLNNFDFLTYHKYRSLFASSLIINQGTFDLFCNPDTTKARANKIKSFPNVAIYDLKSDIRIDTVVVKHINISYSEYNTKPGKTGTITFNNTAGKLLNVTTDSAALKKNNISTAQITSYFMNHGKVNVFFSFNLTDKNASHSYKGSLGPMDLDLVNPATIPLAMVKITSGKLKGFYFDVKANSKISKGKVTILYNDLKVNILAADSINKKLKHKFVATLFANVFILKRDNPDEADEIPRSFNVVYKRPKNSPFFKSAWQTLLAAIKPTVGYSTKTQQGVKERIAQNVLNKQNRKIKKALRIRKRAERKQKRELRKQQKEAQNKSAVNGQ